MARAQGHRGPFFAGMGRVHFRCVERAPAARGRRFSSSTWSHAACRYFLLHVSTVDVCHRCLSGRESLRGRFSRFRLVRIIFPAAALRPHRTRKTAHATTDAASASSSLGAQLVNPTTAELDALGLTGGAKVNNLTIGKLKEIRFREQISKIRRRIFQTNSLINKGEEGKK